MKRYARAFLAGLGIWLFLLIAFFAHIYMVTDPEKNRAPLTGVAIARIDLLSSEHAAVGQLISELKKIPTVNKVFYNAGANTLAVGYRESPDAIRRLVSGLSGTSSLQANVVTVQQNEQVGGCPITGNSSGLYARIGKTLHELF